MGFHGKAIENGDFYGDMNLIYFNILTNHYTEGPMGGW